MKRLILVRHGKSSWAYNVPDKKRPLRKRGFSDGAIVASAFENFFLSPGVAWTSPAVRALSTADIFKERLGISSEEFTVKPALYTFSGAELLREISACDNDIDQLMIFGHNPAITSLANDLGDQHFENVPTTGLVVLEFKTQSWRMLSNGKTILNLFPKNLR